jgi:hypothetical protein
MKKGYFIFLLVIFLFSLLHNVSASYICSDQSQVQSNIREIKLGEIKTIEGLLLGLANTEESVAIRRMSVGLLIDAQIANLTNDNPSASINFTDGGNHNLVLINSTDGQAYIGVDGSNILMDGGEIDTVGSLQVSIVFLQGKYPGVASVYTMAGINKIYLSNYGNLTGFVTAYGIQYLVELSSASNTDATIEVRKCSNESATLIEIADNPSLNKTQITTNTNSTLNNTNNTNITKQENSTSNQTVIYSSNQTNSTPDNSAVIQDEQKNNNNTIKYIALGGLIAFTIVFVVLLVKYIKNRAVEKEKI